MTSASNAAGAAHTSFGESPSGAPASRADDVAASAGATYTSANSEVTPPVWYRRQLPSEPAPDSKTGYFEIVIDTNGDVESVRLISPTRRYEERMLMAAAKAWKFRPARLNGEPVKYRMRVPITLTWTIDH
jgi:TonB family protein